MLGTSAYSTFTGDVLYLLRVKYSNSTFHGKVRKCLSLPNIA
jgi:hypothetical protein